MCNTSDPFGLSPVDIIVQGKNSQMIVDYLRRESPTFAKLYDRLNRDHSVHLTIRDAYDPLRAGVGPNAFIPGRSGTATGTIRFNDISLNQANYQLFKQDPHSPWMFTAASVMAHEMGHANAWLGDGPAACRGDQPPSCILHFENMIRMELPASERGGIRTHY
jgi:hypothetical protein